MINKLIAFIIFILPLPIFVLISLLIFLDDGFPFFFVQKRIGINNFKFWIYKFRTMKKNTPDIPTHLVGSNTDFFTKLGPFFRKYSLDELPQLLNVLKGDLVLIGPRPALHNQEDLILLRTKKGVHRLKPGITGWAQVNGRDNLSIEDKVDLDYYYYKNKSLYLDCIIILRTIIKVVRAEDISR